MRWPGTRDLVRLVTGGGRRTRPGPVAVGTLSVALAAVAAGGIFLPGWALRSTPPARTLALATSVLREPPALDSALEVTWTWSVGGVAGLEQRWLSLVTPTLPPGICLPAGGRWDAGGGDSGPGRDPEGFAGPQASAELEAALRQLDGAVARGGSPAELERRLGVLRNAGHAAPDSRTGFVVRYNLARGYAAAGDWAAAAEVLEPALSGWLALGRVPEVDAGRAARAVADGRVDETLALDAVHGRYLAAAVAYRRGEARRAVTLFRRTINAFHYLLAVRREGSVGPEGHHQRVVAELGTRRCPGLPRGEGLTSLDAYAGLVASYMADEGFRDPAGLPAEVARTRLQIDPGDPFGPVLEHARRTGARPDRTPVPENLLWAASNLQRVYHGNRLRPDPRLEVTRAVLLLRLTSDVAWTAALRDQGGADVCLMLSGLGEDLQRDAASVGPDGGSSLAVDSARAAVAVQTFARLQRECGDEAARRVAVDVRSAWIRLGGVWLTRGVGGLYEDIRVQVRTTMGEAGAPVPVLEQRLRPLMRRVDDHRSALRRGRVPPELPADLPVEPVGRFVDEWRRALWADVAEALATLVRAPAAEGAPVRAGQVRDLLTALESAVAHAGLRPGSVVPVRESAALASTGGPAAELAWRLRTVVRSAPGIAMGVVGGVVLALALALLLVHVSAWRYGLLVRRRFYREEWAEARGARRRAG